MMRMNERVVLERVPLPRDAECKRGRTAQWPWKRMEIGDSFFLKGKKQIATKYWRQQTGYTYVTRRMTDDDGCEGLRIFRIA